MVHDISSSVTVSIGLDITGNSKYNVSFKSKKFPISTSLLLLISEYFGSNNTYQIQCNTSATLTGCDDIQYDQIQQEWDYDPYINGSLLIGSAYGY